MLKLFYAPTTATTKVMLLLEEIGCEYQKIPVNVRKGVQTYSTYQKIVLNGKVPALIDDGKVYMESGNILLHLAEKHNVLYNEKHRKDILTWLFWGHGECSPAFFNFYSLSMKFSENKEVMDFAMERIKKVSQSLENQLIAVDYICGEYSIADLSVFTWYKIYNNVEMFGFLKDYKNIQAWIHRIESKAKVQEVYKANATFNWDIFLTEEELAKEIQI